MNKRFGILIFLSIISFCTVFTSCENPNEITFDINGDLNALNVFTDTLSLDYSTLVADSAVNSGANYLMTGFSDDPIFGSAKAVAFLQPSIKFRTNSSTVLDTFLLPANVVIDSARILLVNPGLIFGDTLQRSSFGLHRLKNSIALNKTYDYRSTQDYEPSPIVRFTISPKSFKNAAGDSIRPYYISLPKTMATELATVAKANAANNTGFNDSYKGFALVPESNAKTLYTFLTGPSGSGASRYLLYFHIEGSSDSYIYSFDFNGPRFSSVKFDPKAPLNNLNGSGTELSLKNANNQIYMQAGRGIYPKVSFSKLNNLGKNIKISRAVLEFTSPKNTLNNQFPRVFTYVLSELNGQNQQVRNTTNQRTYITPIGSDISGGLYSLVDSSATVSLDITNFVQKMSNKGNFSSSLVLMPGIPTTDGNAIASNDNIRRMVFTKPKLRLYYTK